MTDKKKWYPAKVACLDCGAMFEDEQHYIFEGKCITNELNNFEEIYNDSNNR